MLQLHLVINTYIADPVSYYIRGFTVGEDMKWKTGFKATFAPIVVQLGQDDASFWHSCMDQAGVDRMTLRSVFQTLTLNMGNSFDHRHGPLEQYNTIEKKKT